MNVVSRFLPILLAASLLSCNDNASAVTDRSFDGGISAAQQSALPVLTEEEEARLDEIRAGGGLKVATTLSPSVIEEDPDGGYTGFQYELISEVAEYLDISVNLVFMEFEDFFENEGEMPDDRFDPEGEAYTPDALKESDMILHNLVRLDWQAKLMDIIPTLSTRMLIVTREDEPISQLGDLSGKTGIIAEHACFQDLLEELRSNLGLDIDIKVAPSTMDDIDMLLAGDGDFCLKPSWFLLGEWKDYDGLAISQTFGEERDSGWAVRVDDIHLKSALDKVIGHLMSGNEFENIFYESFRVLPEEFYSILCYCGPWKDSLSALEIARLGELRNAGGLRAALFQEPSVYEIDNDGRLSGVHYNLLLFLAELMDVPLHIESVGFSEYFSRNGSVDDRLKTDPDFTYKPDLLHRTDLYVAAMTRLPWREKFLSFIDLYPTRMVYIVKQGTLKPDPSNLEGSTVSLLSDSSYETWARDNLPLESMDILYVENGSNQVSQVVNDIADFTLMDASIAFTFLKKHPNLVFYPCSDDVEYLGWAVSPDDVELQNLIEKGMEHLHSHRTFHSVWKAYYGISFDEYLRLLSLQG